MRDGYLFSIILAFLLSFTLIPSGDASDGSTFANIWIVDIYGTGDFTSIQDAVDAASGGDTIWIYDGNYYEDVVIRKDLEIKGNGTSRTFVNGVYLVFRIYNTYRVVLNNLTITASDSANYAITSFISDFQMIDCDLNGGWTGLQTDGNRVLLQRCVFKGARSIHADFEDANRIEIYQCKFDAVNGRGARVTFHSQYANLKMRDNYFINSSFGSFDYPAVMDIDETNLVNGKPLRVYKDKDGLNVPANTGQLVLLYCDRAIVSGMDISGVHYGVFARDCFALNIKDSKFTNIFDEAILLYGNSQQKIISGNTIEGAEDGILLSDAGSNLEISNNRINNTRYAISIYTHLQNVEITNNFVFNSSERGIYFEDLRGSSVENNTVDGAEIGITGTMYEYMSEHNSFCFNTVRNCTNGINVYPLNANIRNNHVSGCSDKGMLLRDYNDNTHSLENNTFEENSIGLYLQGLENEFIYNNVFRDNGMGLKTDSTSDNMIRHNYFIDNNVQVEALGDDEWYDWLPLGGNYWSDYDFKDVMKGTQQNIPGSDGFGDIPVYINSRETDRYPIFIDIFKPRANAGDDRFIDMGEAVTFDGTNSLDDQMVISYLWEFDYDGEHRTFTFDIFDYIFYIAGDYEVTLNVSDFAGNWDTDNFTVHVRDNEPPVAIVDNMTVIQEEIAVFSAPLCTDNVGITNWTWSFVYNRSKIELFGENADFRFVIPGYYDIDLFIRDAEENLGYCTFNLSVMDNQPPKADGGGDRSYEFPGSYILDGSACVDNGRIVKYIWSVEFGDMKWTLEGDYLSHEFNDFGKYAILLTVMDEFGNSNTDSFTVSIVDIQPPEIVVTGDMTIDHGDILILDAGGSIDNNGVSNFTWSFTDDEPKVMYGSELRYRFQIAGYHNITLTVFDLSGLNSSRMIKVTVIDNEKPEANAGDDMTVTAGSVVLLDASRSTDNGKIVHFEWTFMEDDQKVTLYGEMVEHIFAKGGEYVVKLWIKDEFDNSGEDTLVITVQGTGFLRGRLTSYTGGPIKAAQITILASDGKTYSEETDEEGNYDIEIPFGNYSWEIKASGYEGRRGEGFIDAGENGIIGGSEIQLKKEEISSGPSVLVFVLLAVIILLVLGVAIFLVFFIRSRSGDDVEEHPSIREEPEPTKEQTEEDILGPRTEPVSTIYDDISDDTANTAERSSIIQDQIESSQGESQIPETVIDNGDDMFK
jgi:parallel beta-helix repeat protein